VSDTLKPLAEHPRTGVHKEATALKKEEIGAGGTFLFCRHAEVHNPRQIYYGRMPRFGLTPAGHAQAQRLGQFLQESGYKLDALYTSPLLRARHTAQGIAESFPNLKPRVETGFIEVHSGYDGTPLADVPNFNFYEPLARPDDETIPMVCTRVVATLQKLMRRHKGKTFAAVSHGDPVVILHAFYFGFPMQLSAIRAPNFYPERASVTRYDFPPEGFTADIDRVRISYYEPPYEQ
jgi:broad specificity phosphatase PhoE